MPTFLGKIEKLKKKMGKRLSKDENSHGAIFFQLKAYSFQRFGSVIITSSRLHFKVVPPSKNGHVISNKFHHVAP